MARRGSRRGTHSPFADKVPDRVHGLIPIQGLDSRHAVGLHTHPADRIPDGDLQRMETKQHEVEKREIGAGEGQTKIKP